MKAVTQERFGPPESLRILEVPVPDPGPGEVLVRIVAAALNPYDWHMLRGDPKLARLMGIGIRGPKFRFAGADGAGVVEALGAGVTGLEVGEEVFGSIPGAFAEYAVAPAELVVRKPQQLSFAEAAGLPMAGQTALRGMRDVAKVSEGTRVLINGASGGVGHFAVQVATALGGEVTGVCSAANAELVRSLGAADVVDYTTEDFTTRTGQYDVVLDNQSSQPLKRTVGVLKPTGILVMNAGGEPDKFVGAIGTMVRGMLTSPFVKQRIKPLPTTERRADILTLIELVEAGKLRTVVSATYPLTEVVRGLQQIEAGHAVGKVILEVGAA